jgi:hypothetical protein
MATMVKKHTMHEIQGTKAKAKKSSKTKIGIYLAIVILLFFVGLWAITNTTYGRNKELSYRFRRCFNAADSNSSVAGHVEFIPKKGAVGIVYNFNQKCYDDMEVEYNEGTNELSVYFLGGETQDNCFCDNEFSGNIAPLDPGEYLVNVYKSTPTGMYTVKMGYVGVN